MSKVYQCDRCKATCDMAEQNDTKKFKAIAIGLNDIHLCPHCMKKFEEFLSDPNCMEDVKKEEKEDRFCLNCGHRDNHYYEEPCNNCHDHEKWEPNKKGEVHHCGTCEYQFENGICPRTYTCSNDSIACKKWKLKEVGK